MRLIFIVVLFLILIAYFASRESFLPCIDCSDNYVPKNGVLVINPYVWPYSGTKCVDDLYILNKDHGQDIGFSKPQMRHLNTPDHVELV